MGLTRFDGHPRWAPCARDGPSSSTNGLICRSSSRARLLDISGCRALTAAKIIGETAGAGRFRSKSAYARWNGTAPILVWSGNPDRFRLNQGGNRQVNAALHRIAITQAGGPTLGRAYIERRTAAGDTRREAVRLLRRRLSDVVFRTLLADETLRQGLIEKSLAAA